MRKHFKEGEWRKRLSSLRNLIYTLSVTGLLITACGTARQALPAVSINPVEEEIERHLHADDLDALVYDCSAHPEYAGMIRTHLLYEKDYSTASYRDLLGYRNKVSRDSVLFRAFDAKVRAFENRIYDHVHGMLLTPLVSYYNSHREYRPFLKEVVESGLREQIPAMEYKELRSARESLRGSDFEGMADSAYFVARKAAEPALRKSISSFSKEERSALTGLQAYIDDSLTVYTAHAFQTVLRKISAKDLPKDKSSIDNFVQSSMDASFTSDGLQGISLTFLKDYQDRVNKARSAYYLQLTGKEIPSSALLDFSKTLPRAQMGKLGDLSALYELSKAQNNTSLKSLGFGLAGMLLSGGLGILASAVGSYQEAKEKAERKKDYLNQFSKNFLPAMMGKKDQYFASLKKSVNAEITKSQKAFLDAVYENY